MKKEIIKITYLLKEKLFFLIKKFKSKKYTKRNIIDILILGIVVMVAIFNIVCIKSFSENKNTYLFADVSEVVYKIFWEKDFEMERLKQEAELSKIKEERANEIAQEEIIKRDEAEIAKKEAEKEAQNEMVKRNKADIARKEAEERTQRETILRNEAEEKAEQEEFERKLKEQQLSEKEAEEKKMNADNDD